MMPLQNQVLHYIFNLQEHYKTLLSILYDLIWSTTLGGLPTQHCRLLILSHDSNFTFTKFTTATRALKDLICLQLQALNWTATCMILC